VVFAPKSSLGFNDGGDRAHDGTVVVEETKHQAEFRVYGISILQYNINLIRAACLGTMRLMSNSACCDSFYCSLLRVY
jgi:hypothetical protein